MLRQLLQLMELKLIKCQKKMFGDNNKSTFNWDDHFLAIKQKISKSIGIISRIRKNIDHYITR